MTAPIAFPMAANPPVRVALVVAGHAALGLLLFAHTVTGLGFFPVQHPVLGAIATLSLCGLQLTLALGRPSARAALVIFLVILGLSVGLVPVLDLGWLGSFWFAGAAAFLVLPARWATGLASCLVLTWMVVWWRYEVEHAIVVTWRISDVSYIAIIGPFGMAALYSLARLLGLAQRLEQARSVAGKRAAESERSRVARDLHDLVGQSLSAITLKSGLAERLLLLDRSAASRQLEDLEQIAAELAREVGIVAAGQRQADFADEAERAQVLLLAAGIATTVDLGGTPRSAAADELFGWAVREAATNVLRHSRATQCYIAVADGPHGTWLEIENDRAVHQDGGVDGGSGLRGLADRARALGGRVDAGPVDGDGFHLRVCLPLAGR